MISKHALILCQKPQSLRGQRLDDGPDDLHSITWAVCSGVREVEIDRAIEQVDA